MKRLRGVARPCVFLVLLLLLMLGFHFMPSFSVGNYEVKQMDILADVWESEEDKAAEAAAQEAAKRAKLAALRDTCPKGMECIEDYAPESAHGMRSFYDALLNRASLGRPVRIAYFGDSFIEGDIFTADLRALLQQRFGGCGVGFVDIASPFIIYRNTLRHTASGWTDHNVLTKEGLDRSRLGISCRYALSDGAGTVEYAGSKNYACLDTFEVATLYLKATKPVSVSVSANGQSAVSHTVGGNGESLSRVETTGRMGRVRFNGGSGATYYGVALEGKDGITLDNFSLRGSSGFPLLEIPESHLSAISEQRPYDLIVFQYGLNVADKKVRNYSSYAKQMKKVIERFKQLFPHTSILVVGVGDRENRVNGTLTTMPGILELSMAQQQMAVDEGVAFWNLYNGMGGEGSMRRMAEAKPAQAAKDYTHISHHGGKRLAEIFYRTLMHGFSQYEKRKSYESD